jgi:nitrous oxidase accessory protein
MKYLKYTLLLTLAFTFFQLNAFSKTFKVNNNKELFEAVANAKAGDIVLVSKGNYQVNGLVIDKAIEIIGINTPIFDGKLKGEILTVKSNNVKVSGIQFQNVGITSTIDWAAIKVIESKNVTIENNKLINCYFAIYLSASNNCLVRNNHIEGKPSNEQNTGNGIHFWKCDSIIVINNFVKGQRDGLYFEFVTNSRVEHNISTKNIRYGLHFMFSHKNSYSFNTFDSNGAGVAVMYTKFVKMHHNIFKNNWGSSAYGILLKDITDSEIEDNIFEYNTMGTLLEGCNRIKIERNEFKHNGVAMRVQANCEENVVKSNNFINNTFDLATNGNVVSNTLERNYWDKYEGYDLDKNGIGDINYRPVSLFSTLIERMPQAMMLLRSFTATLLDKIEKVMPSFTPENLKDEQPLMKPIKIIT